MARQRICGIYKITSPTGKIYIGQSADCLRRIRIHFTSPNKHSRLLYNSIKKHGWKSHSAEVVDLCTVDELNEREIFFINFFGSFQSDHGMNLKAGGDSGGKCSEESKRKMSLIHKGKKISEETREKHRVATTGTRNPMYGKKHSSSTRQLISDKLRNHPSLKAKRTDATRKKMSDSARYRLGRTVYQFSLDGTLLSKYPNIASAVEQTGLKRSGIKDCCLGNQKVGYGFHWSHDLNFVPFSYIKMNCKNCGKSFDTKNKRKKFCSHKCRHKYHFQNNDYQKKWRLRNKEKMKIYDQEYRVKNLDKLKSMARVRYMNNRDRILKAVKENYSRKKNK